MTVLRRLTPLAALAMLAGPAAAFSQSEIAAWCPPVSIETASKHITVYPGGQGRSPASYSHIAVILSAAATCYEDENDNLVADVTVHYAVEAGPYYTGSAESEVFVAVTRGGADVGERARLRKTVTPAFGGGPETVTETVRGIILGDEDALEAGDTDIVVGFIKPH